MTRDEPADDIALPPGLRFLAGGGAATRLILARDWSGHRLGPPEGWPDALKVSLALVLNSPESMILAWGHEELSFFFNETYFPLLGPRLPHAMGSPFREVWADGWEQARPIIDEAFAGRSRRFNDLPWTLDTDRGRRETWWSFSYSRVLGADGEVAGLFIFTNETTARVLADAAVRESQKRLALETERQRESLQRMPGFAAILTGPDHVFDYVNDAYVAMAGPRPFIGRRFRDVFPDLADQGYFEALDQVFRGGEMLHAAAMPLRLDGDPAQRFVDRSYQPIRDGMGKVTGIFVGGYDVTDRVRAERRREALLDCDERLGDIADPAGLSFAAADLLGRALGADRAGYGSVDLDAGTITVTRTWNAPGVAGLGGTYSFSGFGTYLDDLKRGEPVAIDDVEIDRRTAASAAAFRAMGVRAFLDVGVREQGRMVAQLFVHSSVPRVWSAEEAALVREIAERTRIAIARREAERTLRQALDTLEARVAERTRELEMAHEQLRQAQKMEAVGQLTGGLAHDFNNLLTAVTGGLELLSHRLAAGRTDGLERYIAMARSGAQRAAALTQRLLAFSRRQTLDPTPTDIDALVAGMGDIVGRTLGPAIEVRVSTTPGLWPVLVDAPQLENALLNLCINARDAMPSGGRLTIATDNRTVDPREAAEEDVAAGDYVALSVADTGIGMTPRVIERVFEPFFTTKPLGEGTGLGLSMIYGFVRQSGGQVRIRSVVEQGTVMTLLLPRHRGSAAVAGRGAADPGRERAQVGETVLLVEDEEMIRALVHEILADAGYRVLEARHGPEGVALLESDERIDLLITDVGLPGGLDGRQVADAGRAARPGLRVLFVTGYAANAAVGAGHMEEGMAVLTKPFTTVDLERRVRDMISAG